MSRYVLSEPARRDLREIRDYIAQDSVSAARQVLRELRLAFAQLARNPDIGHRREDLTDQAVLFWPVHSYLIIYRPHTSPLQIVRVLHAARDVPNLL